MKVVSLFAGIGGFDLAFERAGFEIVAHVERDKACRKLLANKFQKAIPLDDVMTAGANNLPPCDVLTFGFPCQDLSVAGKRAGLEGARSGLFYEATRIADELRPSFLLWENVPGLLSCDDGRDFRRILSELDKRGYHGAWRTLDAQFYGVAQRRRRVFGLFARGNFGTARCAEVLSLAEGVRWHPAPRREARESVAGTLGGSSQSGGFRTTDLDNNGAFICDALRTKRPGEGGMSGDDTQIVADCSPALNCQSGMHHAPDTKAYVASYRTSGNCGPFPQGDKVAALNTATDPNQNIVQVQWASGGGKVENETAQALRAGAETNYQFARIANAVRRLTPRECERLQGFPDDWTIGFPDTTRYKMLGNAVAVPVVEWIARRLRKEFK